MTPDPSDPDPPPRPSQSLRTSQAPRPSHAPRMSQPPSQPPRLAQSAAPDARELVRSTRGDAPSAAAREVALEQVLLRYRRFRMRQRVAWLVLGSGIGAAALAALWLRDSPTSVASLAREPHSALSQSGAAAEVPVPAEVPAPAAVPTPAPAVVPATSASTRALELEPCTPAMRALGSQPLIDDFEDNDARIAPLEHRAGVWSASNDHSATQLPAPGGPLSMARIPGGRGSSQWALHTSGPKFTKWGALLTADLSARRCYDASVYAGLRFFARGHGSLSVVVKMTQVAPEEYGGSCTHACNDSHRKRLDLSRNWQEERVTWAELQQQGFGQIVPFDPRSLLSIELTVDPEQTPFDFWVDDLRFLER